MHDQQNKTFHPVPTNVIICVSDKHSELVDISQGEMDWKEIVIRKTKSLDL